jgi:uncharacterized protein (DUF2225 family)
MSEPQQEQFIDADAIYTEQGFSFKNIVMEHLRKLSGLCSQELRGGYIVETTQINNGIVTKTQTYEPDTRMEVSNGILYLGILLTPHFDTEMEQKDRDIEQQITELDTKSKDYKELLLGLRFKQFKELSRFLHRKNYLEAMRGEE